MSAEAGQLAFLLDRIGSAVGDDRADIALRLADCVRRFAPADPTVALLQSRLLLRTGSALAAMQSVADFREPETLIAHAEAASEAGLAEAARRSCESLLSRYAVNGIDGLSDVVARVTRTHRRLFQGWVGVDSSLGVVGELSACTGGTVELGGRRVHVVPPSGASASMTRFAFAPPVGHTGALRVRVGPTDIVGSGMQWPPDFGLVGWVVLEGRALCGEAALGWSPAAPVRLLVAQGSNIRQILVNPTQRGSLGWSFHVELDWPTSHDDDIEVRVLLPNGCTEPLSGSPLCTRAYATLPLADMPARRPPPLTHAAPKQRQVNVVVPVHSGLRETLACLRSVMDTTRPDAATITVVDDASPDVALSAALQALAQDARITLLRNSSNLGFPGAANRGMRLHPDRDVVLLNADAEVFDGWLERLTKAAYAAEDIGTATPFGEAASIVSYPLAARDTCSSPEASWIDRIAARVNRGLCVDIPVGVGFCLYIKRRCLEDVGELDDLNYAKGYGEENDFCLRARHGGWRHVAATDVFVRHAGGRSYGPAKQVLTLRNAKVLNRRYPGYDDHIARFIATDPLRVARRAIDRQRVLDAAVNPVLLLTFDLAGGVKRHVDGRQEELHARGHSVLILRTAGSSNHPQRVQLRMRGCDVQHLLFDLSGDLSELRGLLSELRLAHIELHHFVGLPGDVLEMILTLGVPHRVYIHDYAWICPRISLLNGNGGYCGEPPLDACETCVQTHGSAFSHPTTVAALRARSARLLDAAERVTVPTDDVRDRLVRYFPSLRAVVSPWETARPVQPRVPARRNGTTRVVLIGAIGTPKGYSVLLACARDAANRGLPLEFVVVGYTRDDATLLATGRVFICGPYEEHEACALLRREACDVALFPSQAPETWCYSLTYVLAEGLPVVAFDIGAVADRLRAAGVGLVLPAATAPAAVNDALLRYPDSAEFANNTKYRKSDTMMTPAESAETDLSANELSASVQIITLPVGIYAFTVKGGSPDPDDGLAVPAFQVAPAPVRAGGSIEFLQGPSTLDRWLTRSGDVVMVKVSQDDATLLLTSLRTPQSAVLAIDVRRLDVVANTSPSMDEVQAADEAAEPPSPASEPPAPAAVRPVILAHVQNVGDVEFVEGWAGHIDDNLWIEAFSAGVHGIPSADLLEYCGVNYQDSGPVWRSGGTVCGSRGEGVPLTAFAVRVKEDAETDYACAYSGRFMSGAVIGPFVDGRLCTSDVPGDPLVAIELRMEHRQASASPAAG